MGDDVTRKQHQKVDAVYSATTKAKCPVAALLVTHPVVLERGPGAKPVSSLTGPIHIKNLLKFAKYIFA